MVMGQNILPCIIGEKKQRLNIWQKFQNLAKVHPWMHNARLTLLYNHRETSSSSSSSLFIIITWIRLVRAWLCEISFLIALCHVCLGNVKQDLSCVIIVYPPLHNISLGVRWWHAPIYDSIWSYTMTCRRAISTFFSFISKERPWDRYTYDLWFMVKIKSLLLRGSITWKQESENHLMKIMWCLLLRDKTIDIALFFISW